VYRSLLTSSATRSRHRSQLQDDTTKLLSFNIHLVLFSPALFMCIGLFWQVVQPGHANVLNSRTTQQIPLVPQSGFWFYGRTRHEFVTRPLSEFYAGWSALSLYSIHTVSLYCAKKAQFCIKRALHSVKRALYFMGRDFCSILSKEPHIWNHKTRHEFVTRPLSEFFTDVPYLRYVPSTLFLCILLKFSVFY